jgi:hypothetical protein
MRMKKIGFLLFVVVLICGSFLFLAENKSKPVSADMEDDSTASKTQMQAAEVSDLEPDFVVPTTYLIDKKTTKRSICTHPMYYVGKLNEDSVLFFCFKEDEYYVKKDSIFSLFEFDGFLIHYGVLYDLYKDKFLWCAYSDSSRKIECRQGQNILFEHDFPIPQDNRFDASFFNHGKSISIKSYSDPWDNSGELDPITYIVDLESLVIKKMRIDSSINVIPFGKKIYYSKQKKYSLPDGENEYSTMDIHCIDENGKESVIAKDAFMHSISPNEKYMLAEKMLYGKSVPVIIDLDLKKCLYLFGKEDWSLYHIFFDELKGEFACDLGTQIEYFSSENSFSHDPLKVFPRNKQDCDRFWKSHQLSND